MVLSRLDDLGRGASIALVVAGFWLWWPLGLAMLAYLAFGRNRHGHEAGPGRWYAAQNGAQQQAGGPWSWAGGWGGCKSGRTAAASAPPSGNRAFDEYRADTLRRLEDEQKEFVEYLDRLRQARDKSEFDQFMAERRNRPAPQPPAEAA